MNIEMESHEVLFGTINQIEEWYESVTKIKNFCEYKPLDEQFNRETLNRVQSIFWFEINNEIRTLKSKRFCIII